MEEINMENTNTQTQELNENTNTEERTNTAETLTMTQEELNAMLQKEGDRRVTSAQAKWEKTTAAKLSEADKLAKMDAEARREYEFEQREKQLEQREREIILQSNTAQCVSIMSQKGLDTALVDLVVSEDADEMNERIKLLERSIKDAVSKQVLERIGSDAPAAGSTSTEGLTKESFRKMPLAEQMALYNTDRDLYNKLSK